MLLSVGDSPSKKPKPAPADEGIATVFKSAAALRMGAGLTLGWFHAWHGVKDAYRFIWNEQPWGWVAELEKAHVPWPHLVAPAVALVIASVAISWTLGFVTRLFSLIGIPVAAGALVIAHRLESPQVETCVLYLFIAITLMLFGSGSVSLDWFFNLAQRPKPPPKRP